MRAASIAKQFSLPAAYAAKVMTQLVRANILHSDRGPRGGFRLTRSPDAISVLEIVEAVDGQFEVDPGMTGTAETRATLLGVSDVFEQAVANVRQILGQQSIATFARGSQLSVREPALQPLAH